MSFTLGLTGGIASGKSLAGETFASCGVNVFDGDHSSREVVMPGSDGLDKLVSHFGSDILAQDGSMDRRAMRERVFNAPEARLELEGILHPLIRENLLSKRNAVIADNPSGYCILMVPLLVKFGWTDLVDRLLVIDSTEGQQIERLISRDDINEELATKMLGSQDSRQQRLEAADDFVLNDAGPEELAESIRLLHKKYQQLASGSISQLPPQKLIASQI